MRWGKRGSCSTLEDYSHAASESFLPHSMKRYPYGDGFGEWATAVVGWAAAAKSDSKELHWPDHSAADSVYLLYRLPRSIPRVQVGPRSPWLPPHVT